MIATEGPAKISLSLGSSRKPQRPAPTNGVKRPHAALRDHDEDEDDGAHVQTVSHFDQSAGGAVDAVNGKPEKGPLVIQRQANKDWKEAGQRKRQRSGLPGAEQGQQNGGVQVVENGARKIETGYGLNVFKNRPEEDESTVNKDTVESTATIAQDLNGDKDVQDAPAAKPKTDDELAMDALLGNKPKSDLHIPAVTEEEAFQRDYDDAPPMATLEQYAAVPVEEFGAAMLRGMGWKEGEGIGNERGKKAQKTKLPERRPALLGIGAKEEAAVAQEMGTWGKAAKDRRKPTQIYNPIVLRNKITGEVLTEEELKAKQEAQKEREANEAFELEYERKRKAEKETSRRHRRENGREYDDDEYNHRKRDSGRDRESDRHRSSRRDRDERRHREYDDDEEQYRRDKERRRREREYDNDRDHRDRKRDDRHGDGHRSRR